MVAGGAPGDAAKRWETQVNDAVPWRFWIDRGGTFTDVVARAPDGTLTTAKLLSEDPARHEDAAIAAIRRLTGITEGPLPACEVRMGTTVATNALLERTGEPTVLAITRGFGDALRIGYQERPSLFVRRIDIIEPPHARVIEIDERIGADGSIVRALDVAAARAALTLAFDAGLRSVAIVLMHGYRYSAHEALLADIAAAVGFTQISVSHRVAPLIKLIGRGDTTLVDAYLSPVLRRYVEGFASALGRDSRPLFMQSNGGLAGAGSFYGKDAILSGPAGGIVGMARTAAASGAARVIGFDMGGTSTDVSHFAGQFERDNETVVAGTRIRAPMLRIHTVAAGGGSVCSFDGVRLQVGPASAGAVPGPAAYGRGGPLTVTDCNVVLGKLQPAYFPALFGIDGNAPIDADASAMRIAELTDHLQRATARALRPEAAAEGLVAIAVANMAAAIKRISIARGHDVTSYALAAFGGAGGQHACLVADALAIDLVLIHPLAGVLSAYGMGLADRLVVRERSFGLPLTADTMGALETACATLAAEALAALVAQHVGEARLRTEAKVFVRYGGTESAIELPMSDFAMLRDAFAQQYRAQFGFVGHGELIADRVRVEAVASEPPEVFRFPLPQASGAAVDTVDCFMAGAAHRVPVFDRALLAAGFAARGPLLIVDALATTVVEPGWQAMIDPDGTLRLTRHAPRAAVPQLGTAVDPVRLEIFNGLFMAIAEEMGTALQRSATSVNICERLDFSCALFDADGGLVANAPHMPVHLGSMGESVRTILRRRDDGRGIRAGDVYALNAPYDGGTHLPDITVIMPVFAGPDVPAFFVAARGHHADIGGISPGSMPPDSRTVEEEGVLFDNVLLVEDGQFREAETLALLRSGRWPSRSPEQNIADLTAQIAACARGAAELQRTSSEYGLDVVTAYMHHVQAAAEAAVRRLIGGLRDGHFRYEMDNGAVVAVAVAVDRHVGRATIDFTGTSAQLSNNFNAPLPVVRAAVLYVLRTLIDTDVPMNDGCLRPITLIVPEGSMLRPRYPAAVVAGNVETSQVVTDALFGALGAMAASQGTMNNFTFGNDRHQYYETIAGGSGAGSDFDGTAAVQTHMTNSRLTDPEVLEDRFPVRLEEFSIRRGSGGVGKHDGGDGAVRRVRFLAPMDAAILSNRRRVPPFGLDGGAPGTVGRNCIERADGSIEELGATAAVAMAVGDIFVIETPGGGGFGKG